MRQYTTHEQTARLREMGFEKPKSIISAMAYKEDFISEPCLDCETAYSIGELLSFLPEFVNWTPRVIRGNIIEYSFETEGSELYYCNANNELIDNLFDMCKKLKEEGVI